MPEKLGPYEIRGELGRGAMAVVWLGWDTRLERQVAIKEPVIPPGTGGGTSEDLAARFVREGQAAARLNHPGIVTIHAAEVYDGRAAIVMEVIEGDTLSSILDAGALTPTAAYAVLDQLLDAVGFAHSRGVVHRDLKPDNIFITHDGRVKLADFGIAHVGTGAALTQAGTVMGTPGYMAPEQVTGQPVDARSDIFAIGVIAYEMFTGHNPFGATDGIAPTTIMYRIVHEAAPSLPAEAFAGLPADLGPVLATALAKNPADRFADTNAFRTALAGGPISTAPTAGMPATVSLPSPGTLPPAVGQPHGGGANWTPYLIAAGVCLALLGGFMFVSGGTTSGFTPTTGVPGSTVPTATGVIPAEGQSGGSTGKPTEDITYAANAHASSTLPAAGGNDYSASNLLDGDRETCWAEGIAWRNGHDYGSGEYVDFDFGQTVTISDIRVLPGYDKDPGDWDRWLTNGRLHKAEFVFSNGDRVTHSFDDRRKIQSIGLSAPIQADSVRMYIRSAYKAKKNGSHPGTADTSIAEVEFSGVTN
ncbi:MAG: protein kinase [Coriobacteriia bacterium]|nr:protein kinase [Coriobacteriia bacterium]